MRKKLRMTLLGLAVVFTVGFTALIISTSRRAPPLPPLPNPNGYDDFVQAGGLLSGQIGDFREMSHDDLRELVVENAKALTLIRAGLGKECGLPIQSYLSNFANASRDLMVQKQIAQLLAAEGRLAELDGRLEDAARSYLDAMRFGNEVSQNGFVINRLVGIACSAIGGVPLAKLVPQLDCDQLKPIIAELNKLDQDSVTWQEVRRAERIFMRHELRKVPNPLAWLPLWWQARQSIQGAESKHHRAVSRVRLLEAELAVRCYAAEHGAPPRQLAELVPQYLERVPQDPFGSQPLAYRSQGTNWLLYSIGPDRKDDGGTPAGRGTSGRGDLLFDSTW